MVEKSIDNHSWIQSFVNHQAGLFVGNMIDSSEKSFYLKAFHGITLTFVLSTASDMDQSAVHRFAAIIGELQQHGGRVLILHQESPAMRSALTSLWSAFGDGPGEEIHYPGLPRGLKARQWRSGAALVSVALETATMADFYERIMRLGLALRMMRLIFLHAAGGIHDGNDRLVAFANLMDINRLLTHMDRNAAGGDRFDLLKTVKPLLAGGVGSISLCRLRDLHQELFTYAGRGSFFSRRHYCQVRPLGLDDFDQVIGMILRAEGEGVLLPRSPQAVSAVLNGGFGGFVSEHHLAGFCGLITEPYRAENIGEVVALYALTRFQGSGVGGRLIRYLKREARRKKLAGLFACTGQERAVAFFLHHGFVRSEPARVPAAKWLGYDPARRESVVCLCWELDH